MSSGKPGRSHKSEGKAHVTAQQEWLYFSALARGETASDLYPGVSSHLASCDSCRERGEMLQKMERQAAHLPLPSPQEYAGPDLSFLPAAVAAPVSPLSWLRERRAWFLKLSEALLETLRPPSWAGVARNIHGTKLYSGTVESETTLSVRLEVVRVSAAGDGVTLTVQLLDERESGLPAPLTGAAVTMHAGDFSRRALTDDEGEALFENIPEGVLSSLTLTIIPARP